MSKPGRHPVSKRASHLQFGRFRSRIIQFGLMQPAIADRQRGIALVAVLWIITALTVLVLSFNASVRSHLDITTTELGLARSQAVIDGALRLAIFKLKRPEPTSNAAASDNAGPDQNPRAQRNDSARPTAQNPVAQETATQEPASSVATWPADGTAHNVAVVGRAVRITIQDEQGFIDLNTAPVELLTGLLARHLSDPSQAVRLAENIADWRDADSEVTGSGAENPAYIAAGRSAGPGNRPFADISELRSVLGISSRDATALMPYLTIYGGTAKINIATAPPEVIQALPDITEGAVSGILRLRERGDTDPKLLLESLARWQQFISSTAGPAYRIRLEVTDRDLVPVAVETTVLILPTSNKPFHILEWREVRPQSR